MIAVDKTIPKPDIVKEMAEAIQDSTELTENQKEFCVRYMQNWNATQAYLRVYGCSYESAKANSCRLLTNDNIQRELRKLRKIKNAALGGLCGEDIVELHMRIAFADMTDFVYFGIDPPIPEDEEYSMQSTRSEIDEEESSPEITIAIKDSNCIDGTLITELSADSTGIHIKLADKMKSLQFLERYFELNPNDRHRREYDNARLALLCEKDDVFKTEKEISLAYMVAK